MTIGMGAQVTRLAMGTVMTHKAFGPHAEECLSAVCEEVDRLERILSRFLPESDISGSTGLLGPNAKMYPWIPMKSFHKPLNSLGSARDVSMLPLGL